MEWTDDWPAAQRLECAEIVDPIDVVELRPRQKTLREASREPETAGSG
jgi:hypothetical protein